ncbi:MAG: phospholipase D-like domain-containing protein [Deltaproteobacteria bacterium]
MTAGGPSRTARAREAALNRAAGGPPIPGNCVRLLVDGPETYDLMLDLIATAERWIHLENYIIRDDRTGWRFAEALAARARDRISVRVTYDWLGSIGTGRRYWRFLRDAGVEVRCFNPPRLLRIFANLTRNHRKLLVADGGRAVIGGQCIGDEWAGDPARGIPQWRDTAVEVVGPAASAMDAAFAATWALTGAPLPPDEVGADIDPCGGAQVRVIAGEPGRERAYRALEYITAGTIDRLWITDAYLVPPSRLFQALVDAARAGADIRLLVPGASDVPVVRNLTRIGYRRLLRTGIRIFEWDGPMLHAKTLVSDTRWARIGTSNLNASSLLGNYELDVLIEDEAFARDLEAQFRRDVGSSLEVERRVYRAPKRLQPIMPSRLARERSAQPQRRRARRELRGRAAVATRTLISGARRSIYGPISLALVVLGLLFIGLPSTMAYAFGGVCVWLAVAAGLEAFARRREG